MDTDLAILKKLEDFQEVPDEQLRWLLDKGELRELHEGEQLFRPGDPIDKLLIILKGAFVLKIQQGDQYRIVSTFEERSISGLLPYSRADKSNGYAVTTLPSRLLMLHKKYFREMIAHQEDLTTALVHKMSSRIRQFTRFQQQNDKMMALGKLSAGLAHELNNPSAAIIRSAQSLGQHLRVFPEVFTKVIKVKLTDEQVDAVNEVIFRRLQPRMNPGLSGKQVAMMERSRKEEELLDWLDEYDLDRPEELAENMVQFGFEVGDLETIGSVITEQDLSSVMDWINQILTSERLVSEIEDASQRINKLVSSVKNYTHMDQAPEKEAVDIHEGLENTLTMLNHKLQKNGVRVVREYGGDLKRPQVMVNELNQVWTNLIDNAIDAMEHTDDRVLTLKTWQDGAHIYVSVADTGVGIPEDIRDKVFDPFFTTKPVGKGSGLGMEVVRQIIHQQHDGQVTFDSLPGKTEFKVCLPIREPK